MDADPLPTVWLDAATLATGHMALRRSAGQGWTPWEIHSVLGSTELLIQTRTIIPRTFAKTTRGFADAYAVHERAGPAIDLDRGETSNHALERAKQWLLADRDKTRARLGVIRRDLSFDAWREHSIRLFFDSHVSAYGALFDRQIAGPIAEVLNVDPEEMDELQRFSATPRCRDTLLKYPGHTRQLRIVDAFLLDMLAKGVYHRERVGDRRGQLLSHPLRNLALDGDSVVAASTHEAQPLAQTYLASILVGSAARETSAERRIEVWLGNVKAARDALAAGRFALAPTTDHAEAEREAIRVAKLVGVAPTSTRFRKAVDLGIGLAGSVLLGLVVNPFIAMAVGAAMTAYTALADNSSFADPLLRSGPIGTEQYRALGRTVPGRLSYRHAAP